MILTNKAREEIIKHAITETFAKREGAHEKCRTKFIDALYDHTNGAAEKVAKKLPQGWVSSYSTLRVSGPGFMRFNNDVGLPSTFKMSVSRLFPSYGNTVEIMKTHPLYGDAENLMREHDAIESGKAKLRETLVALVYAANTVEKLAAAWPKGAKFLPTEKPKTMAVIPASLAENINRMMGL